MDEGTVLLVKDTVGDVQVARECRVIRCNKRLTTCRVEWVDTKEVEGINLNKREYEVLHYADELPSTSGRSDTDALQTSQGKPDNTGRAACPVSGGKDGHSHASKKGTPRQASKRETTLVPSARIGATTSGRAKAGKDVKPAAKQREVAESSAKQREVAESSGEEEEEEGARGIPEDVNPERNAGQSSGEDEDGEVGGKDVNVDELEEGRSTEDEDEEGDLGDLDAFPAHVSQLLDSFLDAASSAEVFVEPQAQLADLARHVAQELYRYAFTSPLLPSLSSSTSTAILPELHVDGFDAEQIWMQLDLCSTPALQRVRRQLKKIGGEPQLIDPEVEEALDELLEGGGDDDDDDDDDDDEHDDGDDEGDDDGGEGNAEDVDDADQGDDDDDDDMDEDEEVTRKPAKGKRALGKAGRTAVDDQFFKLDELERFLEQSEKAAALADGPGDEEDEDDDDDVDVEEGDDGDDGGGIDDSDDEEQRLDAMLDNARKMGGKRQVMSARFDDDDDDDEDDAEGGEGGAGLTYDQFFKDNHKGGTQNGDGDDNDGDGDGDDDGMVEEDEMGEESEDGGSDSEDDHLAASLGRDADGMAGGKGDVKSSHERRIERMKARIAALEASNMADKAWFLKGEVDAGRRPLNSALEVDLDFERSVKPPPPPTEESTTDLEGLIRRRIAEGVFDDVVSVVAPPTQKKKAVIELQDTKNDKALGDLYEEEYVKATSLVPSIDEKLEKLRSECTAMMKHLTAKLDALSRFHFTPKPVIEEVTVKANVPALAMEDVAPQVVSTAALQAPEDVFTATVDGGALKEDTELSREDRKRRRATKKRAAKKRKLEKAATAQQTAVQEGGTAALLGRKSEAAEKLTVKKGKKKGDTGAVVVSGRRSEYTKSATMFAKLQEQQANGGIPSAKRLRGSEAGAKASMLKL